MLMDAEVFGFGALFAVGSKANACEVAHFWIDVPRADDVVARLFALRFEFEFHQIGRKLTIRVIIVFTGFE